MNSEIEKKIKEYPISFEQIIKCIFNVRDKCNEAFDETKQDQMFHVDITGQSFGNKFEQLLIKELNSLGILDFIKGNDNTQPDCYCIEDPDNSIEIKTSLCGTFYNSTKYNEDEEGENKSTKYKDPNKRVFYILIERGYKKYNTNSYETIIKRIYFGMQSLNDWTPRKTHSDLSAKARDSNFKKIYDYKNKY